MSSKADGTAGDAKSSRLDFARSAPSSSLDAGRVDEPFARSVAALSHQIAERFAKEESPGDPVPPVETFRAAQVPPREDRPKEKRPEAERPVRAEAPVVEAPAGQASGRGRWLILPLVFCAAAAVVASGIYLFRSAPAPAVVVAAPPPQMAHPAPAVPATLPPPASLTPPAVAQPPTKETAPEPAVPPEKAEANLYDILEVQARLRSLGINPGPLDGVAGPQTVTAIKRYQESKGKQQTGTVDRELLGQLRRDTDRSIAQGQPQRAPRP